MVKVLSYCPLRSAVQKMDVPLSTLLTELHKPSVPHGQAANLLRWQRQSGRRWQICIVIPVTDANPLQVQRARATAATWARPYLHSNGGAPENKQVLALMYSRQPLLPVWANTTLSLPGDIDL